MSVRCLLIKAMMVLLVTLVTAPSGRLQAQEMPVFPLGLQPIVVHADDEPVVEDRPFIDEAHLELTLSQGQLHGHWVLFIKNPNQRDLDVSVVLNLPHEAVVDGFALDIDSTMRDGVIVPKSTANRIIDSEAREAADPALLEQVAGNVFRCRVYPVRPDARRQVHIDFIAPVHADGEAMSALVPLPDYWDPKLAITLRTSAAYAEASIPSLQDQECAVSNQDGWTEHSWQAVDLAALSSENGGSGLVITMPRVRTSELRIERFEDACYFHLLHDGPPTLPAAEKPLAHPEHIALAWDASASRSRSDIQADLASIEALFHVWKSCMVEVQVFRHRLGGQKQFTITDGDSSELQTFLRQQWRDGATDMSVLDFRRTALPNPDVACWLVFTDGVRTWNEDLPQWDDVPVYPISQAAAMDSAFLQILAFETGGCAALNRSSQQTAQLLTASRTQVLTAGGPGLHDIHVRRLGDRHEISGRIDETIDRSTDLTITYRQGAQQTPVTVALDVRAAPTGTQCARRWARLEADQLALQRGQNHENLIAHGQRFGIVTQGTSMLVLESLEQYVRYQVRPPESLSELRAEFDATLREQADEQIAEHNEHLDEVLEYWRERQDWWQQEHKLPADFTGVEEQAAAMEAMSPSGAGFDLFADAGGDPEPEEPPREGITIEPWQPDQPYLGVLADVPVAERQQAYYVLAQVHRHNPSFYFDCSAWFEQHGDAVFALDVLTNLSEIGIEDPNLLRITAWRLSKLEQYDQALRILRRVQRLVPDDPQSHRHLALVHIERYRRDGDLADARAAADLLWQTITMPFHRFFGLEQIALMELNALIAELHRNKVHSAAELAFLEKIDQRFIAALDVDVRVTLSWDTDNTDIDLHVIEPTGQVVYYSDQRSLIGGHLSEDFTQGFGPEEYFIRRALPGVYTIRCNYFASSQQTLTGPATVTATVFTDYGRANEQRQQLVLRLDEPEDEVIIGTITIPENGAVAVHRAE